MDKLLGVSALLGVPLAFLFGGWLPIMSVLVVMIFLDIITGVTKGFYDKRLRSLKMSQGMIRKAMIFVVIIIANMIDVAMFAGVPATKTAVILFYIAMEGLSIMENIGQMGVPLPDVIKNHLELLKSKGKSNDQNQDQK
ncbi:holin family protein [Salipaludibacillus sp. HK11]|uniref:phage holin family protein n=1 Tax=Salipaludibacillus sp. HK11 TaxID=3394320 RepID=UPI0039FC61E7